MAFRFDAAAALARARAAADPSPTVPIVPTELLPDPDTVGRIGTVGRVGAPYLADEDAVKERAAIRGNGGGAIGEEAEWAAAELGPAGARPALPGAGQQAADASDSEILLDYLREHGPATHGAAATALGWGATRAWRAEAMLRVDGHIEYDRLGRAVLVEQN